MDRLPVGYRLLSMPLLLNLLSLASGSARPDLPFIGCAAPEHNNTQRCYFYVQEEKTWEEADKACRLHEDTYLATVPDYQTRTFLNMVARPRDDGVWIGGKKVPQHTWRWNTGRPYLHKVVMNRTEPDAELCGYVNSANATLIHTAPCTTELKYLCSQPELASTDGQYFVSPLKHWIWYSAKTDCLNRGMDLAVVKDDNLELIQQLLEQEFELEKDPRYWVGLSTSTYTWANNGQEMGNIPFGCGEPSRSSERCIEMMADSKYNDTHCEKRRPYICEWVNKGHTMLDIGCLDSRCFYYVEEPMIWKDANRTCRQYADTSLVTIPDYHTQFYLNSMVTQRFLTKRKDQNGRKDPIQNGFWTGGHLAYFKDWTFVNGEEYKGDVDIDDRYEFYHCGSVRPGDTAFHGLLCSDRQRFLCLTIDPHADVLKKENHFISSKTTQVLDWAKARRNCLSRGMELASGSLDLLQHILRGETGRFWVGLTKSALIWDRNKKTISHLQFRCGEPNNYREVDEFCVEMWVDGEYNDNLCSTFKPFVCEWDRDPVTISSTKSPFFTLKPTEPTDHSLMYAAVVGWVLMTVFLLAFVCLLAFSIQMYRTNVAPTTPPGPMFTLELENPNDPTLDRLLFDEIYRVLLNALANRIHISLPLGKEIRLWAMLERYDVVDHSTKEDIQGQNNPRTNVEQVASLFEHLRRGTNRRYYYFRAALVEAGFSHVVRHFRLPAQTPSHRQDQDGRNDPPRNLAATEAQPKPSVWSRCGRFLRNLLSNPSTSPDTTPIENSEDMEHQL